MRSRLLLGLGVVGLGVGGLLATLALDARPVPPSPLPRAEPRLSDEQNGWPVLRRACDAYDRRRSDTRLGQPSLALGADPRVAEHLAANADTLRLADEALARPQFHFAPQHYVDDVADFEESPWAGRAMLIGVLYELRSLRGLAQGRDSEAAADAISAMRLGRQVQGLGGSLHTRECGEALEMAGYRAARRLIGCDGSLSGARRDGMQQILAMCLDERDLGPSLEAALAAEAWLNRVWLLPSVEAYERQATALGPVLVPLMIDRCETVRQADAALRAVAQAATAPTWSPGHTAQAEQRIGYWPLQHNAIGRRCSAWVARQAWSALRECYDQRASRRLLATAVALRLYQAEHGRFPASLETLVAARLLPAVPLDPFDGRAIRYRPQDGAVYSVGFNGRDDGGVRRPQSVTGGTSRPPVSDDHAVTVRWAGQARSASR